MCKFFKSKDWLLLYVIGLLGGTIGYVIGKLFTPVGLTPQDFVVFLIVFAGVFGACTEYIYRKNKGFLR